MRSLLAAALAAASLGAWAQAPQAPSATPEARAQAVRQAVRDDKRGLVEKNMALTPQEAKAFWPLYDAYQRELDRIVQKRNRALTDYVNAEATLTDANAKRIVREILDADMDEQKLLDRHFRKLAAVLPPRKAVRYLQIENKIRTVNRYDIAERFPLVQ